MNQLLWIIYVIFLATVSSTTLKPLWSWDCIEYKCVPVPSNLTEKPISLESCNMLCGNSQLWPRPTGSVYIAANGVPIHSQHFHLEVLASPSTAVTTLIRQAFDILRENLRTRGREVSKDSQMKTFIVRTAINGSAEPRLLISTDESYQLSIRPKIDSVDTLIADIAARSFCGVRHALETLSQLVWYDPYTSSMYAIESATVEDAPKYPYRGLMLDTARSFVAVEEITKLLDAMAACKLNTFHWHATDSQSFPLQLSAARSLWMTGAYSADQMYSLDDIRLIVRRALLRGIRVVIEVDTPAHVGSAWSWGPSAGLGTLALCTDDTPWSNLCNEPPCGQLNPLNTNVYRLLDKIYEEILQLTGINDVFHLGGDDISEDCWRHYFNNSDPVQLWMEFTRHAFRSLATINKGEPSVTILWSSKLSSLLRSGFGKFIEHLVIQNREYSWSDTTFDGLRYILSHSDVWDFNTGLGRWFEEEGGATYNSWEQVYEHRPWALKPGMSNNLLLGGEGLVWSERLGIGELEGRVWPRAAALAERLWSDPAESGARSTVAARLDVFRSRLIARGIYSAPLWSMWCTHNPFTC